MSQSPVTQVPAPTLPAYLADDLATCINSGGVVLSVNIDRPNTSAWVQTQRGRGSSSQSAERGRPLVINHRTPHGEFRITIETL